MVGREREKKAREKRARKREDEIEGESRTGVAKHWLMLTAARFPL
jgi:hypothetical protein